MFSAKRIAVFAFLALLFYGLLAGPWPGFQKGYAAFYQVVGNAVFGSFGSGGLVRFQPIAASGGEMDTEIVIRRRDSPVKGTTPHSAWVTGYLPTAECIALILATPLAWRRKLKALLWGLLLVNAFVAMRITITLIYWFGTDGRWALYQPGPFWSKVLYGVFHFVAVEPAGGFAVPALIWMLVCFRSFKQAGTAEHSRNAQSAIRNS